MSSEEDTYIYNYDDDFVYDIDYFMETNYMDNSELEKLLFEVVKNKDSNALSDILNSNLHMNINVTNEENETLLTLASKNNDISSVNILLKNKNILLNKQDNNGDTALHISLRNKNNEISNLLLNDWRLHINTLNCNGESYLHLACILCNLENVEKILKFSDVELCFKDICEYSPLEYVLLYHSNIFANLIIKKIVEHKNFDLMSLKLDNIKLNRIWGYLTKENIEYCVNSFVTKYDTFLTFSCKYGHIDLFNKLLTIKNLDINMYNKENFTAIELTLKYHHIDMFVKLIHREDLELNPNFIHFIFEYFYDDENIIDFFKIILLKPFNKTGINKENIINHSIKYSNYTVFKYFYDEYIKYNKEINEFIYCAISRKDKKVLYYLLKSQDIKINDEIIFHFLSEEDISFIQLMIELGINVNCRNPNNYTPYMLCIMSRKDKVIELLREKSILTKHDILELLDQTKDLEYLLSVLDVNFCEIYGDDLGEMPDKIFNRIIEIAPKNIKLITHFDLNKLEYNLDTLIYKIKNIELELCHNTEDFAFYENFIDMDKAYVIQYGNNIDGKYRTIKLNSLLDLTQRTGYGYLKNILDPFDRSKLYSKKSLTTGLYIYKECILRKILIGLI